MDNLRLILIVVASLAIIALLIHGFWINKKERSSIFSKHSKKTKHSNEQTVSWQNEPDEFDDIGEVRVISSSKSVKHEPVIKFDEPEVEIVKTQEIEIMPVQCDLFSDFNQTAEPETTQNKHDNESLISQLASLDNSLESNTMINEQKLEAPESIKKEELTDVLVLHVSGLNGDTIRGDSLLNSILQSGFQYGEMQIFHRHVDPAGNGPVLFSLANMVKPGYLNPETMSEMVTPGISLFMMIPTFGDNQQNFKMMLQSAQRIADDVDGVVLDDEHHMITPQKIASYKERIKKVTGK